MYLCFTTITLPPSYVHITTLLQSLVIVNLTFLQKASKLRGGCLQKILWHFNFFFYSINRNLKSWILSLSLHIDLSFLQCFFHYQWYFLAIAALKNFSMYYVMYQLHLVKHTFSNDLTLLSSALQLNCWLVGATLLASQQGGNYRLSSSKMVSWGGHG